MVKREIDIVSEGEPEDILSPEEESEIMSKLGDVNDSVNRLLDIMDNNLSLLEGSIREVRTAHEIAAESNRMARRRSLREGNPTFFGVSK